MASPGITSASLNQKNQRTDGGRSMGDSSSEANLFENKNSILRRIFQGEMLEQAEKGYQTWLMLSYLIETGQRRLSQRVKSDRHHTGVEIILAATHDGTCPVVALRTLFTHDLPSCTAPLFCQSSPKWICSLCKKAVSRHSATRLQHHNINVSKLYRSQLPTRCSTTRL